MQTGEGCFIFYLINSHLKLPYIDFEVDLYLERHVLAEGLQQDPASSGMLPRQFHKMMTLEYLYSRFDGTGAGHQSAQSLDQSYYTALQVDDLRKRDEDQVVLNWFRDKKVEDMGMCFHSWLRSGVAVCA